MKNSPQSRERNEDAKPSNLEFSLERYSCSGGPEKGTIGQFVDYLKEAKRQGKDIRYYKDPELGYIPVRVILKEAERIADSSERHQPKILMVNIFPYTAEERRQIYHKTSFFGIIKKIKEDKEKYEKMMLEAKKNEIVSIGESKQESLMPEPGIPEYHPKESERDRIIPFKANYALSA